MPYYDTVDGTPQLMSTGPGTVVSIVPESRGSGGHLELFDGVDATGRLIGTCDLISGRTDLSSPFYALYARVVGGTGRATVGWVPLGGT